MEQTLTFNQLKFIMKAFDEIQNGNIDNVDLAFEYLPEKNSGINPLAKLRAINTYVISNNAILEDMATEIINNQSDQNEVSGNIATPAGVKPVKNEDKFKAKLQRYVAKQKSKRGKKK